MTKSVKLVNRVEETEIVKSYIQSFMYKIFGRLVRDLKCIVPKETFIVRKWNTP